MAIKFPKANLDKDLVEHNKFKPINNILNRFNDTLNHDNVFGMFVDLGAIPIDHSLLKII